jgi:hypothetical protein
MADARCTLCLESALAHLYSDPHRAFFRLRSTTTTWIVRHPHP